MQGEIVQMLASIRRESYILGGHAFSHWLPHISLLLDSFSEKSYFLSGKQRWLHHNGCCYSRHQSLQCGNFSGLSVALVTEPISNTDQVHIGETGIEKVIRILQRCTHLFFVCLAI